MPAHSGLLDIALAAIRQFAAGGRLLDDPLHRPFDDAFGRRRLRRIITLVEIDGGQEIKKAGCRASDREIAQAKLPAEINQTGDIINGGLTVERNGRPAASLDLGLDGGRHQHLVLHRGRLEDAPGRGGQIRRIHEVSCAVGMGISGANIVLGITDGVAK